MKGTRVVLGALVLLVLLAACGTPASGGEQATAAAAGTITIGSKDFTEQIILGELYAQALEAKGYTVNRKLRLGSVQILDQALINKQIDMYPEYTGTTLEALMKYQGTPPKSPDETYQIVKDYYAQRVPPQTMLAPAKFNNTYGVAVRREVAQRYNLKTLEDVARESANLVFASFSVFQAREDGFPNIQRNYPGMNFKDVLLVNTIGLRYKALEEGDADLTIGFTTDGQIASQDLVVMEDPKNIWPFYYPAPVINTDYLRVHPDVEGILNAVSEKLDAATMQRLNATVDVDQEEPAAVAAKFLQDNGLK